MPYPFSGRPTDAPPTSHVRPNDTQWTPEAHPMSAPRARSGHLTDAPSHVRPIGARRTPHGRPKHTQWFPQTPYGCLTVPNGCLTSAPRAIRRHPTGTPQMSHKRDTDASRTPYAPPTCYSRATHVRPTYYTPLHLPHAHRAPHGDPTVALKTPCGRP